MARSERPLVGECRNEYYGNLGALAQVPRGFDPVLLSLELDVHQDQVGRKRGGALDGLARRFHHVDYSITHHLETHPHVERDDVLVLDDEYVPATLHLDSAPAPPVRARRPGRCRGSR